MALQDQSVNLANAGLKVSLDMSTYKRPIREILDKIDEMGIDLVSMATHGESDARRALEESVTAEVIRHSNCPLLVWSAEPQCHPATWKLMILYLVLQAHLRELTMTAQRR